MTFKSTMFALGIFLAVFASPCFAWNAMGHKVVAEIAWQKLDPSQRAAIVATLRQHPRFDEDFADRMDDQMTAAGADVQDHWIFCQAATWPDIARGTEYDRPLWHYINLPVFISAQQAAHFAGNLPINVSFEYPTQLAEKKLNGPQAVKHSIEMLASSGADDEKAIYYCWVLHVIGDLHQPLHTSALFTKTLFPGGDHGGNKIQIKRDGSWAHPQKLHAMWDSSLGKSNRFNDVLSKAQDLITAHPSEFGMPFVAVPNDVWTTEVQQLALSSAYGPLLSEIRQAESHGHGLSAIEVPAAYFKQAGDVAGRQAVIAGVRLAGVLAAVLNTHAAPQDFASRQTDLGFPAAIARTPLAVSNPPASRALVETDGEAALLSRIERLEQAVQQLQAQLPFTTRVRAVQPAHTQFQSNAEGEDGAQCDCGDEE
jgi:hypothetical protein